MYTPDIQNYESVDGSISANLSMFKKKHTYFVEIDVSLPHQGRCSTYFTKNF